MTKEFAELSVVLKYVIEIKYHSLWRVCCFALFDYLPVTLTETVRNGYVDVDIYSTSWKISLR